MNTAWPHAAYKLGSVLFFTEIAFFHSLLIDLIAFLDLDAGVNNGNQMNILLLHLLYKLREIRELVFIYRKILEPLHVVDIHIHAVQGHLIVPVLPNHPADILRVLIAPPALSVSHGPFRRNIASSYGVAKLLYHLPQVISLQNIKSKPAMGHGHGHKLPVAVAEVKGYLLGGIHKYAEPLFSVYEKEVVGSIEGMLVLRMLGVVGTVRLVKPAPLVYSPDVLPQAVDDVVISHPVGKDMGLFLVFTGKTYGKIRCAFL